ncbi:hypothetical protein ABZY09_18180 [Streptomyces sp. NPDC002928]|uniref:hypothetical protein n=1 Tax=Streptomyces sp. NPDC002928 TaxID=3154440 RepID=UPI0033B791F2
MGARIRGEVIGRQPFGVFIRIDGVALAEIVNMPHDLELPAMGAEVAVRQDGVFLAAPRQLAVLSSAQEEPHVDHSWPGRWRTEPPGEDGMAHLVSWE